MAAPRSPADPPASGLTVVVDAVLLSKDGNENAVGDIRCCTVLVSEIRIEGCGTTVRLAVAVLPTDCGELEVTCCGCGC